MFLVTFAYSGMKYVTSSKMIQPKIEGVELYFRKTLIHNNKGLIFFPASYAAILIPKISRIVSEVQY